MKQIPIPNYPTEKPDAYWLDLITERAVPPSECRSIRWNCSYQCETDYESPQGRIKFRYGKVPWNNGKGWNYPNQAEFDAQHNGNWGIVSTWDNEPINADTLALFRSEVHPLAVTGYYDHLRNGWVACEPTTEKLCHASWLKSKACAQFFAEHPTYAPIGWQTVEA